MNPSWEVIKTKMRRNHRDDLLMHKSWPTSLSSTEFWAYHGVNGKMCTKCDQNREGECGRLITQNKRERGGQEGGKQRDKNSWDSKEKKKVDISHLLYIIRAIQGLGTDKVGLREICTLNRKWLLWGKPAFSTFVGAISHVELVNSSKTHTHSCIYFSESIHHHKSHFFKNVNLLTNL